MSTTEHEYEPVTFSPEQYALVEQAVDRLIPGSARVGAAAYLDASAAGMPAELVSQLLATASAVLAAEAEEVGQLAGFGLLRALSIEAYYSDFVRPDLHRPGAWQQIGFDSAPQARVAEQDWTFLPLTTKERR